MKLSILIPVLIAGGLLASYCYPEPPKDGAKVRLEERMVPLLQNPLNVIPREQEGYYTCWAACAEMIMEFLGGGRVRQCEQANEAFDSLYTCCRVEDSLMVRGLCDQQWNPEFCKWGFDYDFRSSNPLTWEELKKEINEGRPFAFSWVAHPGINHMLVAIGYQEIGGERRVFYLDPLNGTETDAVNVPFSDYDGSSGVHPHICDYFRIRPGTCQ